MKKVIINIHSFVDVITNSSTEIYVCSSIRSENYIKELFREKCEATGEIDWYNHELSITSLEGGNVEIYSWLNDPDWFHEFVRDTFTVVSYNNYG